MEITEVSDCYDASGVAWPGGVNLLGSGRLLSCFTTSSIWLVRRSNQISWNSSLGTDALLPPSVAFMTLAGMETSVRARVSQITTDLAALALVSAWKRVS